MYMHTPSWPGKGGIYTAGGTRMQDVSGQGQWICTDLAAQISITDHGAGGLGRYCVQCVTA
eukprot:6204207-Pyramimonas_sp.AAC.1